MLKSKPTSLIVSILIAICAIMPLGCNSTSSVTPENNNAFFSNIIIAQANGDVVYTPTIDAEPSHKEIPLLSGDVYKVCSNYEPLITTKYNLEKADIFAPTPLTISWESKETPLYYTIEVSANDLR